MFWRFFRTRATAPARDEAWWRAADAAADAPRPDEITQLRSSMRPDAPVDEAEQQEEMLDGLEQLVVLVEGNALPVLTTQHRVIGTDVCHLALPATLSGEQAVPGKLFLTSRRIVFAGGSARSWPWHLVRGVARRDRTVIVHLAGGTHGVQLDCNTFGDALGVVHLSRRLAGRPGPPAS